MAVFENTVTLATPLAEVFAFFLKPENALQLSPPEVGLHFVNAPEIIQLGSKLEFKVHISGHVQNITHEITALEHEEHFTETQIRGPFKSLVHEHIFTVTNNDEVTVMDRITFQPPGGLLRFLVTENKILDYLDEGFGHRSEQLKQLLG